MSVSMKIVVNLFVWLGFFVVETHTKYKRKGKKENTFIFEVDPLQKLGEYVFGSRSCGGF